MDLKECRKIIDEIDDDLLKLFIKRMDISINVAKAKKADGLPILNSAREQEVINNATAKAPDELKAYVKGFFVTLMEASKCYQVNILTEDNSNTDILTEHTTNNQIDFDNSKVACQGTVGAYSHTVGKALFNNDNITFFDTFSDVFEAVKNGNVDYGVLPMENSTAGGVCDVYDLLKEYNLYINHSYKLKIEHCLVSKNDCTACKLKSIYSHQQALDQCSDYLKALTNTTKIPYLNTALAAKHILDCDDNVGAICSEDCAKIYGLNIIKKNIQNFDGNYTRFIVISKNIINNCENDEISICLKVEHKAGELNKLMTKFSLYNINMSKIESRPIGDENFNVLFYINFSGNIADQNVQDLINDLTYNYSDFKLLGTY